MSNVSDLVEASSRDGKWAQNESESSSVFDESDLESLRKSLKEKGRLQALQKATESKPSVDIQSAPLESPLENSKEEQHENKGITNCRQTVPLSYFLLGSTLKNKIKELKSIGWRTFRLLLITSVSDTAYSFVSR